MVYKGNFHWYMFSCRMDCSAIQKTLAHTPLEEQYKNTLMRLMECLDHSEQDNSDH
ncbi:hypothetical protein F9C07_1768 [Aspergillus flavus]|uniref:Uncharacterized protein n=1 Tax=Aspergillus flavus (strain ATCC 200026 / FGSC A1120 / IAM 13836 / NRRL 3357 / JCM 12722 / SRRC 167) TaxID=332952 RepID=A0A7U2MGH1_ASPFN|nr:hypothetical protein F9C07_1768 [Aspergillus flavus]